MKGSKVTISVIYALAIVFMLWFFCSWMQIVTTNCVKATAGNISAWNLFMVLFP